MLKELKENYGHLFEDDLLQEINNVGTYKEVHQGDELIRIGQYIKSMPLLLHGAIKILREDDEGFELLLYYLERGETCAMTLSCCTGNAKSSIRAIAERDSTLIMVPVEKLDEWASKYSSWRSFIFGSYHNRLNEIMDTVDNIAFKKMDQRLLHYLKEKAKFDGNNIIQSTHQDIAYDLHTSRVVVSRLLKQLEKEKMIKLKRNSIELINI
ncbi:MAG: Crp/Fnr family transcriptional regulator [Psychroflexus halocasei]|uniref:Crp/Fnr family transcriptional regulator n=1 Tax=Psychroflexus sp. S27 TaxID=1982757 RepID=UPI000C2A497A|nr:Crp/Fnr family transcriptional regulator [Psychroflexus sp. S27]PJX25181.1 Crp/Fnr family transcriptional regulator [Psychroflexus sp. S27]